MHTTTKIGLIILLIFLNIARLLSGTPTAFGQEEVPLLVLHSYHKGYSWTDNIQKGIESVLEPENNIDLTVEYMDSKSTEYNQEYKEKLFDLYKYKYGNRTFDLIISSDDNSFDFLREYHEVLFPDTPMVFCGVNNTEAPDIIDHNLFTGLVEVSAHKETLELALELHPETRKAIVIIDNTPSGKYWWELIRELLDDPDFKDIEFSRIDDSLHVSEIKETLNMLSDDTVVLFGSYFRDKSGVYFPLGEAASRFSTASSRPMYGFHAEYLPYGLVGGKLLGGVYHGRKAAEMALRILDGEKVKDIPVITETTAQYMFNFEELVRFGISPSDLPEDRLIINEPFSFYEEYKSLVWATICIMAALVGVIVTLQVSITKRKRAEDAARQAHQRYVNLANNLNVGIYRNSAEGHILEANSALVAMTEAGSREELLKHNVADFYKHPMRRKELVDKLMRFGFVKNEEILFVSFKGREIWTSVSAVVEEDEEGNVYIEGFLHDITERKRAEEALRESQQLLERTFASLRDAVFIIDADTVEIVDCNPAASELFGYSRQEMLGRTTTFLHVDEAALEEFREHLYPAMEEKGFLFLPEFRMKRKDGTIFPTEHSVIPLEDEQGKRIGWVSVVRDITERKRAEEALRESEEQYRRIVETAYEGIWIIDAESKTVFANRRMTEMLGYTVDEIMGKSLFDFIDKEWRAIAAANVDRRRRGVAEQHDFKFRRKDGAELWTIVTTNPFFDEERRYAGALGMITDITERKRAEEALRRREQEIRVIADNVPALFSYLDADGCYRFVNKRYEEWFGVPRTEIMGKHYRQVLGEVTYEQIKDRVETALSGQRVCYEEALPYARGGTRWVLADYVPDTDEQGKVRGFFALVTDITERKGAEEALRETEERLSNFMDSATDGFILFDSEMNVVEINRAALKIFGVGRDVIGKNAVDVSPDVVESGRYDKYTEVMRTGKPFFADDVVPHRKFGDIYLAIRAFKVGDGLGTIVTNITERKRAEEELREYHEHLEELVEERTAELAVAKERAEAADRLKSAFLATMSHELRTPLNSIIGFTGIMLQGLAGPLNPEQEKQLNMVYGSARRLLALINDILDLSKIEAGEVEVVEEEFDVAGLINKVVKTVSPLAEQKGLELAVALSPEVGRIYSDRRRVEQTLLNLVNNAIKFTERGWVRIEGAIADQRLQVSVQDTGIGIKPEDMGKLFQAFRQVDAAITREHEGTGLGLAICKKLVTMLGGEIWAESEGPGKGSRFTFRLPVE